MDALAQNVFDMLEEGQLKLGYRREAVRLYYPLSSLNALLGASHDRAGMLDALAAFSRENAGFFGPIAVSARGDTFCLTVPPEGSEAVHARADAHGFLAEFLRVVSRHGATMDEALAVFRRHSDRVVVEPLDCADFDVLVYFADGKPDAYRYCIAREPEHLTYHRFTQADYEAFGF